MISKSIQELTVGERASFTKTISERDVSLFAEVTGDFNPVHVDEEYAAASIFKGRIAHGALAAGLISAVLGMQLPGAGVIYISQSLKFLKPVYLDDSITAEVEVVELLTERNRVRMRTSCTNQHGDLVAEGESLLMPRKAQ